MSNDNDLPEHPGHYIRESLLKPLGLSVTAAAKTLGVGRQALSDLLNGNASLSPEMAARIGKAFNVTPEKLLEVQGRFERYHTDAKQKELALPSYVPALSHISARDIDSWAHKNIAARTQLAALLRTLIHSTTRDVEQINFPAYDNAERRGWDGSVTINSAHPWVPTGHSTWEFGCTEDAESKAESDYAARSHLADKNTTFVFVTPRNWPGKTAWQEKKSSLRQWKSVRALDADDLEQWIERSLQGQIWLSEKLKRPIEGYASLEECWTKWSCASPTPLPKELFTASIESFRSTFISWLNSPPAQPFIVAADSRGEALAFLACLMEDDEIRARPAQDIPIVFTSPAALGKLSSASTAFMPIVYSEEAERELTAFQGRLRCVIIRPRNAVDSDPDIALDLLRHEDFRKALQTLKLSDEEIDKLALESGRSPTILRRRMSNIPAVRTPPWAQDATIARSLIPMTLVGAWHNGSKADCEVISLLAQSASDKVEREVSQLRKLDDAPVWAVGKYRGVASKIDALFAIAGHVIEKDLSDFLFVAEFVLSERDPALDLSEENRWAAGLYGKVRDHSSALREGICETLAILGVYGNDLFQDHLGFNVEAKVEQLINKLLQPLTIDKLLTHDGELPRYAEATPNRFLELIEEDLRQPSPAVLDLMKPVESSFFGSGCPRSGLLWALELLAWKPDNLRRVVDILARLSLKEINDNWGNKPEASLQAIFRGWMPQTSATLEQRTQALERLCKSYPSIGWSICVSQFDPGSTIGHYSSRPKWRSDASGAGQPISRAEHYKFVRKCIDMAISWPRHDEKTLGDLIERLQVMTPEQQDSIWDIIDRWAVNENNADAKVRLRERLRRYAFTRRGIKRGLEKPTRDRAREAYVKLTPTDAVLKHQWLFEKPWVEESLDELEDETVDFRKREERIKLARRDALSEIWRERGFDGLTALLSRSEACHIVGSLMAAMLTTQKERAAFILSCLASTQDEMKCRIDPCLSGFVFDLPYADLTKIIALIDKRLSAESRLRLYLCLPFRGTTWQLLETQPEEFRRAYWANIRTYWADFSPEETSVLVDRLLEAQRPASAFHALHLDLKKVETSRLKKLLSALPTTPPETPPTFKMASHEISDALAELDKRGVGEDDMAHLEFMYLDALDHSEYGIPNLQRQIAKSPSLFMQALALAYKRSDGKEDPPEWHIKDENRRMEVATAAYRLLDRIRRIPGTDDTDNSIKVEDLKAWLTEVRSACKDHGREEMGDQKIGELLSRSGPDTDGIWPCKPVCEVMEWMASKHVAIGFEVGKRNSRGAHWRGEGGNQERDLSATYRGWAHARAFEFPYVASVLESIAASYDREAQWQDSEAKIRRRLRY